MFRGRVFPGRPAGRNGAGIVIIGDSESVRPDLSNGRDGPILPGVSVPASRPVKIEDWRLCSQITRVHGRTFYFASQLMSPPKRRAIHSAYAFCRIADDLVDDAPTTGLEAARERLAGWEMQVDDPIDPVARAYGTTRATYAIPARFTHELFEGMRMDLEFQEYETWDDLYVYCYRVAGTIGLISSPILGARTRAASSHAVELGVAMQLTNILRDVAEDAAAGRLYLPIRELAQFGIDPESVMRGTPNGDFPSFMAFQIERARGYYASAEEGIKELIPSGQITALASSHMYSRILCQIEAQRYDVFSQRAYISTGRKVRELPLVMGAFLRLRLT